MVHGGQKIQDPAGLFLCHDSDPDFLPAHVVDQLVRHLLAVLIFDIFLGHGILSQQIQRLAADRETVGNGSLVVLQQELADELPGAVLDFGGGAHGDLQFRNHGRPDRLLSREAHDTDLAAEITLFRVVELVKAAEITLLQQGSAAAVPVCRVFHLLIFGVIHFFRELGRQFQNGLEFR